MSKEQINAPYLKIGDSVNWSGCYGKDLPQVAIVESIDINGVAKDKIRWNHVIGREVIIDLTNNHWAYGFQISAI
jgi:hypothetical protein